MNNNNNINIKLIMNNNNNINIKVIIIIHIIYKYNLFFNEINALIQIVIMKDIKPIHINVYTYK